MNSSPKQRPPTVAEHIVRMYSLWPESFACWINHDKVYQLHSSFLFLSFILPILPICPWETTEKTRERTNMDTPPQEVVWNHCLFNLHRWIGRHACRGIDNGATFTELRFMSLSFGDRPNYSLLANYSAWSHLSGYWSWALAYHLCVKKKKRSSALWFEKKKLP